MKESEFRRQVIYSLKECYGKKIYPVSMASMYIEGGNPDIICCIDGIFVGIELKSIKDLPTNENKPMLKYGFTALQSERCRRVIKAGGKYIGMISIPKPFKCIMLVHVEDITPSFNFNLDTLVEDKYLKVFWDSSKGIWDFNKLLI